MRKSRYVTTQIKEEKNIGKDNVEKNFSKGKKNNKRNKSYREGKYGKRKSRKISEKRTAKTYSLEFIATTRMAGHGMVWHSIA